MDENESALADEMNQAAWAGAWAEFLDAFNHLAALKPKKRVNDPAWAHLFDAVLAIEALQQQPARDDDEDRP
jgi:hypothetical protein